VAEDRIEPAKAMYRAFSAGDREAIEEGTGRGFGTPRCSGSRGTRWFAPRCTSAGTC